jgi:hypothetical protein
MHFPNLFLFTESVILLNGDQQPGQLGNFVANVSAGFVVKPAQFELQPAAANVIDLA